MCPLPVSWASSFLLEAFYTTLVARYGLAAFEAPRILSATSTYRGFYNTTSFAQPLRTALSAVHSTLTRQLDTALSSLAARRAVWARLRPWYLASHTLWSQTPYSNPSARAILTRFTAALTLRHTHAHRAEREAHDAFSGLYYYMDLRKAQPGDAEYPERDWVFAVLGLMMQAVMPAREDAAGYEYGSREAGNVWTPSRAAVDSGQGGWRFEARRRVYEKAGRVYTLSKRHQEGHLRENEYGEEEYVGNRLYLLAVALLLKQQGEGTRPVPAALAAALTRELQSLFGQAAYEKDDDEWLDWGFEFPAYSEQLVTVDEEGGYVPWGGLPAAPVGFGPGGHMIAMAAQVRGQRWPPPVTRGKEPWLKNYFTVSEVGERISHGGGGTNWALAPDDEGGYDVFDVSCEFLPGFLRGQSMGTDHDLLRMPAIPSTDPNLTLEKVLEKTPLGRQIVSQKLLDVLRANTRWPVGKLLTWKHPQEVAEHDGLDGRSLWHAIGNSVYNLTSRSSPIYAGATLTISQSSRFPLRETWKMWL